VFVLFVFVVFSERAKKLKKRGLEDVDFFQATMLYLQQCSNKVIIQNMFIVSCSVRVEIEW